MTQSEKPNGIPEMTPDRDELEDKLFTPANLNWCISQFLEHGCLIIKQVFNKDLLENIRQDSIRLYESYISEKGQDPTARAVIPLRINQATNHPNVYANPFALPIVNSILDQRAILRSFYLLISPVGVADQAIHRDHPLMFSDECMKDFPQTLPPFDIRIFVPLVQLTPENGPPRIWPRSHILAEAEEKSKTEESGFIDPYLNVGDCLIVDGRLLHKGARNRSKHARPIIYYAYSQPWFRDTTNFYRVNNPVMSIKEFAKVPDEFKPLLEHYLAKHKARYVS